ncbi:MAG TPA: L,D-transpeptidase [Afifellaceae bacterium]|nr:L,D-transpeptidase [Afifellaceae bacterium]
MRTLLAALILASALWLQAAPSLAREVVEFSGYRPGTIVVKTSERRLYLVVDRHRALRYAVGVGRPGKQWTGDMRVLAKYVDPKWIVPEEIRHDNPALPAVIAPGPKNPLGPRAIALSHEYAIHGTNRPDSIGGFVSYGCIRMHNADVLDLFERVQVGTRVVVLP